MSEVEEIANSHTTLEAVASAYTSAHGALSLIVCAFGIPMNVLNITVLTRKNMRTPVNCILVWLAFFDLLTMISYVPFSLHFYCLTWNMSAERNSWGWMTFLIFHVDFTSSTHTISIWLGVTLAMFRYKHVFSPAKGHLTRVRRLVRARLAVLVVVILSVVVMIPNYLINRLMPYPYLNPDTNHTVVLFVTDPVSLGTSEIKPLAQATLLLHGILAKFLPCILMVVYGGLLVKTLRTNIRLVSRNTAGRACDFNSKTSVKETSLVTENEDTVLDTQPHGRNFLGVMKPYIEDDQNSGSTASEVICLKSDNQLLPGASSNEAALVYLLKQRTFQQSPFQQTPLQHTPSQQTPLQHTPSQQTLFQQTPSQQTPFQQTPFQQPPFQQTPFQQPPTTPLNRTGNGRFKRRQDNSRTTLMLLSVITLFLVTELPQAILIVLSATMPGFFLGIYVPLGDIMDMLALVNNGINFLLYCAMSRDFRTTLMDMMKSFLDRSAKIPCRINLLFESRRRRAGNHQEMARVNLLLNERNCSL